MAKEKDIHAMAEELGVKNENLDEGLKKQPEGTKKGITAAYKFLKSRGKGTK